MNGFKGKDNPGDNADVRIIDSMNLDGSVLGGRKSTIAFQRDLIFSINVQNAVNCEHIYKLILLTEYVIITPRISRDFYNKKKSTRILISQIHPLKYNHVCINLRIWIIVVSGFSSNLLVALSEAIMDAISLETVPKKHKIYHKVNLW